jgi:hypothetical protein
VSLGVAAVFVGNKDQPQADGPHQRYSLRNLAICIAPAYHISGFLPVRNCVSIIHDLIDHLWVPSTDRDRPIYAEGFQDHFHLRKTKMTAVMRHSFDKWQTLF